MKRSNVIIAKIIIAVVLLLTMGLGVFKLIDYLSEPKALFYASIDEVYNDYNAMLEEASNNKLYSILSSSTVSINAETKVTTQNIAGTSYEKYQTIFDNSSFVTNISFDKNKKYLANNTIVKNNSSEKVNILYVDTNLEKYKRITEENTGFKRVTTDGLRYEYFDSASSLSLGNIIKDNFKNALDDERFTSSTSAVGVNGETVDVKENIYTFTGAEMQTLYDNISSGIQNDSAILNYLADIWGIKSSQVRNKLNTIKEDLDIKETDTYSFKAFTKKTTDELVEFSIVKNDSTELFAYSKALNYKLVKYVSNGKKTSIKIDGELGKDASVTIEGSDYTFVISAKEGNDNKTTGTIKLIYGKDTIIDGTYDYTMSLANASTASISLNMDLAYKVDEGTCNFNISSAILVNGNVSIDRVVVESSSGSIDERNKKVNDMINEFMSDVYTYYSADTVEN